MYVYYNISTRSLVLQYADQSRQCYPATLTGRGWREEGGVCHRFGYWSGHSVGCLISVSSHSLLVLARPLCLIHLRLASSFVLRWQCLVGSVHVQIELLTCLITVCCLSRLSRHGFWRFSVALTCVVVTCLARTFAHAWMNAHNFRRQNISTGMSKY